MEQPLQITYHGLEPTDALQHAVEEQAAKLERFYGKIVSCHVIVESPHQRHQKGNIYGIRVRLTVPGRELMVSRDPPEHVEHEDAYLAIQDAFKETTRRLEDYVRRRRRRVKRHVGPPHARVIRIFRDQGYGFLETADGREIYFHENSVLHRAFRRLEVGTEVRFAEEPGEKGPQASTVRVIGKERQHEPRTESIHTGRKEDWRKRPMSVTKQIQPKEWQQYFDRFTKQHLRDERPESATIELLSPDLGDQVEVDRARLLGITFDPRSDALEVLLENMDHRVFHPKEIRVEEEPDGFVPSIEIVRKEGEKEILTIRRSGLPMLTA